MPDRDPGSHTNSQFRGQLVATFAVDNSHGLYYCPAHGIRGKKKHGCVVRPQRELSNHEEMCIHQRRLVGKSESGVRCQGRIGGQRESGQASEKIWCL
jgi:hypothetical protein